MTDRELLELAAKAAGYWLRSEREPEFQSDQAWVSNQDLAGVKYAPEWRIFDPISNDADAFRLAAALKIDVIHNDPQDNVPWVMANGFHAVENVEYESHRLTATRRAITRAAAEIQLAREKA